MKFTELYKEVMTKRFLVEADELGLDTVEPTEVGNGVDDEVQHQEAIEDSIISYLKGHPDNETTYGDLKRHLSSSSLVKSPDDIWHHLISAVRNNKELSVVKKGKKFGDSPDDVITYKEVEIPEDDEAGYKEGDEGGPSLEGEEDEVFSPEDRADQAILANLPKDAMRDYQRTTAGEREGRWGGDDF